MVMERVRAYSRKSGKQGAEGLPPDDWEMVNTTSRAKIDHWGRALSPMLIGPVEMYGGMIAQSLEAAWQFSKVFAERKVIQTIERPGKSRQILDDVEPTGFLGEDGEPTEAWWEFARAGWAANLDLNDNASRERLRRPCGSRVKVAYTFWDGRHYSYVEARKAVYLPLYIKYVTQVPGPANDAWQRLQAEYQAGQCLKLYDVDGRNLNNTGESYEDAINNTEYPFGHSLILCALLEGVDLDALQTGDLTKRSAATLNVLVPQPSGERHIKGSPDVAALQHTDLQTAEVRILPSQELTTPMDQALLPVLSGVRLTSVGLILPDDLPVETWEQVGVNLKRWDTSYKWALADWLAHGRHRYGKKYKRASELTGLDEGYLRNIASVGDKFEMSRRRDNLTFSHHQEVAALSNDLQDQWLARADADKMTVKELRQAIQSRTTDLELPAKHAEAAPSDLMADDQAPGAASGQPPGTTTDDGGDGAPVSLEISQETSRKIEEIARHFGKSAIEWLDAEVQLVYRQIPPKPKSDDELRNAESVTLDEFFAAVATVGDVGH